MATPEHGPDNGQLASVLTEVNQRLTRLEHDLGQIKSLLGELNPSKEPWWKRSVGVFAEDDMFERVVEWMRRERQKDYERVQARMDREEQRKKQPGKTKSKARKS